ncbi:hypothetical protein [Algoriphagus confluentis]|uniref:Uncharacterized protein n=1 Tax=Algoriphagus confluentis TaxID=1697556 RepID=A0ABQ6PMC0_9BACT|nr:hypothetical protein Aconfl_17560 [Algoriphagus confluentis]
MRLLSSLFIFIILLAPVVNTLNALDWVDDYYGWNIVEILEVEEERTDKSEKTKFFIEFDFIQLESLSRLQSQNHVFGQIQEQSGFLFSIDFPPELS